MPQLKDDLGILEKEETKDSYQLSPHFHKKEFNQPQEPLSLDSFQINPILISKLEQLRTLIGNKPIKITSGYRSQEYNKKIGGASKSQHMEGNAADIMVEGINSKELAELAKKVGFGYIQTYPNKPHLHVDVRGMTDSKNLILPKNTSELPNEFFYTLWDETSGGKKEEIQAVASTILREIQKNPINWQDRFAGTRKNPQYIKASTGKFNDVEKKFYSKNFRYIQELLDNPTLIQPYDAFENIKTFGEPSWVKDYKTYKDIGRMRFYSDKISKKQDDPIVDRISSLKDDLGIFRQTGVNIDNQPPSVSPIKPKLNLKDDIGITTTPKSNWLKEGIKGTVADITAIPFRAIGLRAPSEGEFFKNIPTVPEWLSEPVGMKLQYMPNRLVTPFTDESKVKWEYKKIPVSRGEVLAETGINLTALGLVAKTGWNELRNIIQSPQVQTKLQDIVTGARGIVWRGQKLFGMEPPSALVPVTENQIIQEYQKGNLSLAQATRLSPRLFEQEIAKRAVGEPEALARYEALQPVAGGITSKELPSIIQNLQTKGVTITGRGAGIRILQDTLVKDIYGNKIVLPAKEEYQEYKLSNNQVLLHDGENLIVNKNQLENIKGQNLQLGEKEFASELKGVEIIEKSEKTSLPNFVEYAKLSGINSEQAQAIWKTEHPLYKRYISEMSAYITGQTKFSQYQLPGGENYREVLIKAPVSEFEEKTFPLSQFKSSHWDESNVLAHLRVNDRITPDGKEVLFIEEIQSDWAKSARQLGIELSDKEVLRYSELRKLQQQGKIAPNSDLEMELSNLDRKINKIPQHPLLKNWQELALKQALKIAIDGNYDAIAWTTGEQQAERYDLSKQVDHIIVEPAGNKQQGKYFVNIYKEGQSIDAKFVRNEQELEQYIGKEPARKAVEKGADKKKIALENLDLKIGGEWARNLYDKQIPNILKDLTKGEVKNIKISTRITKEGESFEYNEQGELVPARVGKIIDTSSQQSLELTPEAKARLVGEQPKAGGEVQKTSKQYLQEAQSTGKITHETVLRDVSGILKTGIENMFGWSGHTTKPEWVDKNVGAIIHITIPTELRQYIHSGMGAQMGTEPQEIAFDEIKPEWIDRIIESKTGKIIYDKNKEQPMAGGLKQEKGTVLTKALMPSEYFYALDDIFYKVLGRKLESSFFGLLDKITPEVIKRNIIEQYKQPEAYKDLFNYLNADRANQAEIVKNISVELSKYKPQDIQSVRQYIESGNYPETPLGQLSKKIEDIFFDLGKQLVEYKILTPAQFGKYAEKYFPYFYRIFNDDGSIGRWLFRRLDLSYSKHRKDMPEELRQAMGIIDDSPEPIAKRMIQEMSDLSLQKFFTAISQNPELAMSAPVADFVKLPKSKKLGALSEMYIHKTIADELQGMVYIPNLADSILMKMLSLWKIGKVVLNPPTVGRNMLTNFFLADVIGGVPPEDIASYINGLTSLRNKDKYYQLLKNQGVIGTEFFRGEIEDILNTFNQEKHPIKAGLEVLKKAGDLYSACEEWTKLTIFRKNLDEGISLKEAARLAETAVFNYSKVSPLVRQLRQARGQGPLGTAGVYLASPFITFRAKAVKELSHAVFKRPFSLMKYALLFSAIGAFAKKILGVTKEEKKKIDASMQNRGKAGLFLPLKDKNATNYLLDLTFILPVIGDFLQWQQQSKKQGFVRGTVNSLGLYGNPLITIPMQVISNKNFFSGEDIVGRFDNAFEKQVNFVWQQSMPPLVPFGGGWKVFQGQDLPRSILSFAGLRMLPYNERIELEKMIKRIKRLDFEFNIQASIIKKDQNIEIDEKLKKMNKLFENYKKQRMKYMNQITGR